MCLIQEVPNGSGKMITQCLHLPDNQSKKWAHMKGCSNNGIKQWLWLNEWTLELLLNSGDSIRGWIIWMTCSASKFEPAVAKLISLKQWNFYTYDGKNRLYALLNTDNLNYMLLASTVFIGLEFFIELYIKKSLYF